MTSGMDNANLVLDPKFLHQYEQNPANLTVSNN